MHGDLHPPLHQQLLVFHITTNTSITAVFLQGKTGFLFPYCKMLDLWEDLSKCSALGHLILKYASVQLLTLVP